MTGAEFEKAQIVLRQYPGQYSWARCEQCNEPATHFVQDGKDEFSLFCAGHAPLDAEAIDLGGAIISGGRALPSPDPMPPAFDPENLEETVSRLRGSGLARLRAKLNGQFGIRLQSEDSGEGLPSAIPQIITQTLDASPENPYVVEIDQFILDPFTGPGQFDLVERDVSDEVEFDDDDNITSGGESQVTIANKSGFAGVTPVDGWSPFRKVITSDKVYSVVFVPGTTGDGIFMINVRSLYHTATVLPLEDA